MKFKATVTVSRRKQRKAALTAHSSARRKLMSAHLSKELAEKYEVRARRGADVQELGRGRRKAPAAHACTAVLPVEIVQIDVRPIDLACA